MKTTLFIAIAALLGVTANAATIKQLASRGGNDVETHFAKFTSKFQRNYKNKDEYGKRLSNFKKNKKIVDDENSKNAGYELEVNKFADLSDNEF